HTAPNKTLSLHDALPISPEGCEEHECGTRLSFAARRCGEGDGHGRAGVRAPLPHAAGDAHAARADRLGGRKYGGPSHHPYGVAEDRKSTRLNSSHSQISY